MIFEFDFNLEGGSSTEDGVSEETNRLIIKTNNDLPIEDDYGAIAKIEGYDNLHIMQYTSSSSAEAAYEYYSTLSEVEFVEYDFVVSCDMELDSEEEMALDNYFWGPEVVETEKAWEFINNSTANLPEIIVAVLDSGIDSDHTLFKNRIIDSKINVIDSLSDSTEDDKGHGTKVAGVIVQNTKDNVKISPYKVLNSEGGGYYLTTCTAIDYAIANKVDVINLSLAGTRFENNFNLYTEKIQKAFENGIITVAAAGNDGTDAAYYCPAGIEKAITVSAISSTLKPWTEPINGKTSNYGEFVDIAAPGVSIYTAEIDGFCFSSGTSIAAPFVSAAVSAFKSMCPDLPNSEIVRLIKETAYVPDDWNSSYGVGIVNFYKMVSADKTALPKVNLDSGTATLTANSANTQIYYTTDGTDPVIGESELYTAPFSVRGIDKIKAVACAEGLLPSDIMTFNMSEEISQKVVYKSTTQLDTLYNSKIRSIYSTNQDVVTVDIDGNVYGVSKGNADVVMTLENGMKITYHIYVYYDLWQWIIIILLFGFIWYI